MINSELDGAYGKEHNLTELYIQLRNVKRIYGAISIEKSSLTNLDFLKTVESIERIEFLNLWEQYFRYHDLFKSMIDENDCVLNIDSNPNLTSIRLPKLRTLRNTVIAFAMQVEPLATVKISNNPKLRMDSATIEHFKALAGSSLTVRIDIQETVCTLGNESTSTKTLSVIDDCEVVIGNMVFDQTTDIEFKNLFKHLSTVHTLHGCLTIRNTKFEDLKFLNNLVVVNCSENRVPVVIKNNVQLKSLNIQFEVISSQNFSKISLENNPQLCSSHVLYLAQLWDLDKQEMYSLKNNISCLTAEAKYERDSAQIVIAQVMMSVALLVTGITCINFFMAKRTNQ